MKMTIIKGSIEYINDCEDVLVNSELGKRYFDEIKIRELITIFFVSNKRNILF